MNGLMLHCGGQLKTREEVFAVPAPPATATYTPLSYESFLVRIEKQLTVEGIKITEERLALAKEGQRLFGLQALSLPGFGAADFGCVLGLRTSYDRSFANGICIGAAVFVCDNLSFPKRGWRSPHNAMTQKEVLMHALALAESPYHGDAVAMKAV
jgi:hypothetical protein